jgi:hypothetical protein
MWNVTVDEKPVTSYAGAGLEKYDFNKGSQSLIRATEGTIFIACRRNKILEGATIGYAHP